jgi:hypothetical protein
MMQLPRKTKGRKEGRKAGEREGRRREGRDGRRKGGGKEGQDGRMEGRKERLQRHDACNDPPRSKFRGFHGAVAARH